MSRRVVLLIFVAVWLGRGGAARAVVGERADSEAGARPVLRGADLNLMIWESSGIEGAPEAYTNSLTFILEPVLHVGRQWFPGRWAAPLDVSARLSVSAELAGGDPEYRSSAFASPVLLRDMPEQVAIGQVQSAAATPAGRVDGSNRRAVLSDLWVSAFHSKVAVIPKLGIALELGARVVLPTSVESRVAGLRAAPSLFLGLSRSLWRFHLEYGFRAVKYFYGSNTSPIAHLDGPVLVNGQLVDPYRPASTGVLNPSYGFINFFSLSIDLPARFSIEVDYFVFNAFTYGLSGCAVEGVAGADLCADGAALGDVRRPGQRDNQWFLVEVDWSATSYLSLGLGLSTFQPIRRPDGEIANPFLRQSRDNYTTVYLSVALNAEALAAAAKKRKGKP